VGDAVVEIELDVQNVPAADGDVLVVSEASAEKEIVASIDDVAVAQDKMVDVSFADVAGERVCGCVTDADPEPETEAHGEDDCLPEDDPDDDTVIVCVVLTQTETDAENEPDELVDTV